MKIRVAKNKIIELGFVGTPDDELWADGWKVRLARRWSVNKDWSFYIMIWSNKV